MSTTTHRSKPIVILLTDLFNNGGIQAYNRHLCEALATGFPQEQFIVVSMYDQPRHPALFRGNIRLVACKPRKNKFTGKWMFAMRAWWVIICRRPRFLICGHVGFAGLARFFRALTGLRYSVITHGTDVWDVKDGVKYNGLKEAQHIIAVSNYTKMRMVANGIAADKIALIFNTVDTSLFYPKAPGGGPAGCVAELHRKVLLTVGRIERSEKYKGHDCLLEAVRLLGGEYLFLVAGTGDDLQRLKEKTRALGLEEQVRFLGYVSDVELVDYYNLCDVFLMPSKGEGFGIVFLEALACGKPVIGGNTDGSVEPLMNGRLGFLVDPDDPRAIADTVRYALTHKEARTDPVFLRGEVEKQFGIGAYNQRVHEIFSGLLR